MAFTPDEHNYGAEGRGFATRAEAEAAARELGEDWRAEFYVEGDDGKRYSMPPTTQIRLTHNLDVEQLQQALDEGGLLAPSTAIQTPEHANTFGLGFGGLPAGKISLVLKPEVANNPDLLVTFGDAWSITPQHVCLLYTSPSPRDRQKSRMPSSA